MSNWVLLVIPISLIFGVAFFALGVDFGDWQFKAAGIVAALVGPAASFWIWRAGETTRVVCGPEGFRTETTSRRRGTRPEAYCWEEVTATRYVVQRNKGKGDEIDTFSHYFHVDTARGEAFQFDENFRGLAEVVAVCNAMTTHLPYLWQPRQPGQDREYVPPRPGLPLSGEVRPVGHLNRFLCAARPAPSVIPSAPPPPLPPARPAAPGVTVPPPLPSTPTAVHAVPPPLPVPPASR